MINASSSLTKAILEKKSGLAHKSGVAEQQRGIKTNKNTATQPVGMFSYDDSVSSASSGRRTPTATNRMWRYTKQREDKKAGIFSQSDASSASGSSGNKSPTGKKTVPLTQPSFSDIEDEEALQREKLLGRMKVDEEEKENASGENGVGTVFPKSRKKRCVNDDGLGTKESQVTEQFQQVKHTIRTVHDLSFEDALVYGFNCKKVLVVTFKPDTSDNLVRRTTGGEDTVRFAKSTSLIRIPAYKDGQPIVQMFFLKGDACINRIEFENADEIEQFRLGIVGEFQDGSIFWLKK